MRPTIEPGERLTIRPATNLRVGDVVAAIGADGLLHAHRVVRVTGERLWTRGDASRWPDPPIGRSEVLGLVARGGAAGAAIARWPALAPLLGALTRVRSVSDVPGAVGGLGWALAIRVVRGRRRGRTGRPRGVSAGVGGGGRSSGRVG
jgi:hypothetical protein